jgi:hypothetical protein
METALESAQKHAMDVAKLLSELAKRTPSSE